MQKNNEKGCRKYCNKAKHICRLFIDSFKDGGAYKEEFKIFQNGLKTKAWLFHIFVMATRILAPITGSAYWQNSYATYLEKP